jgi:hypothetical protein
MTAGGLPIAGPTLVATPHPIINLRIIWPASHLTEVSEFFPQLTGKRKQGLLNTGDTLLASRFFRMVEIHEPFTFDADDLVNHLIRDHEGFNVMKQLLDAAEATSGQEQAFGESGMVSSDPSGTHRVSGI